MLADKMEELTSAITGLTPEVNALRESITNLKVEQAVIAERVRTLQRVVYGAIGATFLQLLNSWMG